MSEKNIAKRINIIFYIILIFGGGLLIGRLFFLQVVSGDYYKSLANRQHAYSRDLTPKRGDIYLQNKAGEYVPLAGTKDGFDVYINPRAISENNISREDVYENLKTIIDIDKENLFAYLKKTNDPFEVIVHNVENDIADRVVGLDIKGVGVVPEEWRFYPAGSTASHVVGFLGYQGDELEGRYGIERYFEDVLRGESGYVDGKQSSYGFFLDLGSKIFQSPKEGYDIVLTLDVDVQLFLEESLSNLMEKWSANSAGGIVLDPQTGRIIALAATPEFNPNSYGAVDDINVFKNPLLENVYELGSVFKPLTMAAAIDGGAVTPETEYTDYGYLILNKRRIENYDGKARGVVNMQEVLSQSLNTGAVFAMQQLGRENFYEYMINYGFDSKTDIELPGEVVGSLVNLDSPRDIEYATVSYGQGISVTSIAAARAFSALANGGLLMQPYIVDRIIKPGQPDYVTKPKIQSRVLKEETSEIINRMLVKVVDEALLGGTVKNPRYTIAAKTGTALIPSVNSSGYSDKYLHSFFGYGPGFDAKFLVFLYLENPYGVRYASQSLTKPFMNIMNFLFSYYEIPPDR